MFFSVLKNSMLGFYNAIYTTFIRNRKIIKTNGKFIKNGCYKNVGKGDVIRLDKELEIRKIKTFNNTYENNSLLSKLSSFICEKVKYRVSTVEPKYYYATNVIICSNGKELKFIDYENKNILTLYNNQDRMKRYCDNKKHFEKYFTTPPILKTDNLILVEELVDVRPLSASNALGDLLAKYRNYFLHTLECVRIDKSLDSQMVEVFNKIFGSSPNMEFVIGMPKILVHGDLWSANILCDESSFYITDFEASSYRFFLYDLFYFMFMEYAFCGNSTLLDDYFNGKYDEWFRGYSSTFDVGCNQDNKQVFYLAFLVQVVFEKWTKNSVMQRKIKETFDKYNIY